MAVKHNACVIELSTTRKALEQTTKQVVELVEAAKRPQSNIRQRESPTPPQDAPRKMIVRRLPPETEETTETSDRGRDGNWITVPRKKSLNRNAQTPRRDQSLSIFSKANAKSYAEMAKNKTDGTGNLSIMPPRATIAIEAGEDMTFSEVLKKIKTQSCLKDANVTSARITAAGFRLLQFGRDTTTSILKKIKEEIAKAMGDRVTVNASDANGH